MRTTFIRIRHGFASAPWTLLVGMLVCAGIALFTWWYASAGRFSTLVPVNNVYIDLGEAFLSGQLSLLEKPDPEFMALEDPYDPTKRIGHFIWDASYYKGQYYLYWGPVPALAFAALEGITDVRPSGSLLVVICYIGLPILLTAILYRLRRHFFSQAPGFSIGLCTLTGFINLPFLFLLARPAVYETSIISGQFFLFLGLLGWVMYLTGSAQTRWLVLTGLGWGLTIGSRHTLGISIGIYLAFVLWQLIRDRNGQERQRTIASLLIPFALCMAGLGIYNFARFGNPLETGVTYQLSLLEEENGMYSPSYILSNLFVYLFYPLTTTESFPFVLSTLPAVDRFDEVVAGLMSSVPAIWLLALAVPSIALAKRSLNPRREAATDRSRKPFLFMILAAALAQFLFLTMFYFTAMRYLGDFYLQLVLGIWILVWQVDESTQAIAWLRTGFWMTVTALVAWTVGVGFFGSFDIPPQTLRVLNPDLYRQIASYWNGR